MLTLTDLLIPSLLKAVGVGVVVIVSIKLSSNVPLRQAVLKGDEGLGPVG
jgi:hypothetical protein